MRDISASQDDPNGRTLRGSSRFVVLSRERGLIRITSLSGGVVTTRNRAGRFVRPGRHLESSIMRINRRKDCGRLDSRQRRRAARPGFEAMEGRRLLATFTVTSTADSGANTLRQAIIDANALA